MEPKQYYIGVDVGGTSVKEGLFDEDGNLLAKASVPTPPIVDAAGFAAVTEAIDQVVAKAQIPRAFVAGIGLAVPCPIPAAGDAKVKANISINLPELKIAIQEHCPDAVVKYENDANAAAMGEAWLGSAKGVQNVVMVTIGTGVGGGVIIKPLMDVLHGFDVQTIGVLSSLTVFSMSVVSIGKQMLARTKIPFGTAIPLALGSVAGGLAGEKLLQVIVDALRANSAVTVVQNVVLSLLILAVFLYMKNKSRIPSQELRGVVVSLLVGVFLGICSSFLGIGGGPINVALIIYLFSFDTKTATVCSLVTILFAQISKLTTVALTTGFGVFDLSIAPVMIVGAIAGGFIGASLNKKCSEAAVEKAFNAVQLLVLAISIFNIVRNLAA